MTTEIMTVLIPTRILQKVPMTCYIKLTRCHGRHLHSSLAYRYYIIYMLFTGRTYDFKNNNNNKYLRKITVAQAVLLTPLTRVHRKIMLVTILELLDAGARNLLHLRFLRQLIRRLLVWSWRVGGNPKALQSSVFTPFHVDALSPEE